MMLAAHFPIASNFGTISDGVQYFPFLVRLVFLPPLPPPPAQLCTFCTSSARPRVCARLDMEMSNAADR